MSRMNTFTGKKFDPMEIRPEDINERDVAHALSLVCRGCGHLRRFYSVAQHSVNCALEALARGAGERKALICLLHDASEAYISDIIRPVKCHIPKYYEIEDMIMRTVLTRFGLDDITPEEDGFWRMIDDALLENELKALLPGEEGREPAPLESEPDLEERPFREIEARFLELFYRLYPSGRLE